MAEKIANWLQDYPKENFGAVIGATQRANIKTMRNLLTGRILLIPGIGAQGGDLKTVLQEAKDSSETPNILVNSSRSIIFASKGKDFATAAREEARKLTQEMKNALNRGSN
jgi:orotidine-5'-phosphate decarboxylase